MSDRIPCIGAPRCRRTASREKMKCREIVCAKCFKLCPVERKRYRWLMKMSRHMARYPEKWPLRRREKLWRAFDLNWERMRRRLHGDDGSPIGLDAFLDLVGL